MRTIATAMARRRLRPGIGLIGAAVLIADCGCSQLQPRWTGRDRSPAPRTAPVLPDRPARMATTAPSRMATTTGRRSDWTPVPSPVLPPRRSAVEVAEGPPPRPVAPVAPVEPPAASVETPPAPAAPSPIEQIDALIATGYRTLDTMRNYRVDLDRQERVNGTLLPREQVILSVRREPFAVRLEWPDGPNKGREVLYSTTECQGMMVISLGVSLVPIPPMRLAPDSPMALSNSRHPITEAGLEWLLQNLKEQVEAARGGDPAVGVFTVEGPAEAPDFGVECAEIVRRTPAGECWRLLLDAETGLPVRLQATDAAGELLERYEFRRIEPNLAELDDAGAFDPAVRFRRPTVGGLFGQLETAVEDATDVQ